jgi:hypothetical protein
MTHISLSLSRCVCVCLSLWFSCSQKSYCNQLLNMDNLIMKVSALDVHLFVYLDQLPNSLLIDGALCSKSFVRWFDVRKLTYDRCTNFNYLWNRINWLRGYASESPGRRCMSVQRTSACMELLVDTVEPQSLTWWDCLCITMNETWWNIMARSLLWCWQIMTDPDAPSPSEPSMREWVHW